MHMQNALHSMSQQACCHSVLIKVVYVLQGLQAVASGAIASDYQRLRVEAVCGRLGLTSLAYLWHQPQARRRQAHPASASVPAAAFHMTDSQPEMEFLSAAAFRCSSHTVRLWAPLL